MQPALRQLRRQNELAASESRNELRAGAAQRGAIGRMGSVGQTGGVLWSFAAVFQRQRLWHKGQGLGDLRVRLGVDLEALKLAELGGEKLGLDGGLDPIQVVGNIRSEEHTSELQSL